jgi:hypothetical protein
MNSGMIQDGVQDISTFVPNQLKIFSNDWNLLKKIRIDSGMPETTQKLGEDT